MNYSKIASILDNAAFNAEAVSQISQIRKINLEEAYAIQNISMARRYKRSEKFVGIKMGFTSKAKMEQMGVHDLIWGSLTDAMQYFEGEQLEKADFIHPRAEPEVAFLISQEINSHLKAEEIINHIGGVAIAIEIIDSRYQNFKFSLEDVVADNCSSSGFIIGEWQDPGVAYREEDIELLIDGELKQKGNTRAILGDPLQSLVEASRLLEADGSVLSEGNVVLAGAATAAEYIDSARFVEARSSSLGNIRLEIV
jgi:2-oxo-3-hexenedioate decarboxylase